MNEVERMNTVLVLLLVAFGIIVYGLSVPRRTQKTRQFTIRIDGYSPLIDDDYVAVSMPAEPGYIVRFEPFANADRIHHILLHGCDYPAKQTSFWRGFEICRGPSLILYAWARNAPDLSLPEDVAFSVGHEMDTIKYLVMQVHYAHPFVGKVLDYTGITLHMVDAKPSYLAAVFLFVSGSAIPPGFSHFQTNMSCQYNSDTPIHPFAYRTHTHGMGRVVSAFYKHSNKWIMIGKRNPQWPQLFEPIQANLIIRKGDLMAATCVYDSSMQKTVIRMGSTGADEMCNFYMMFYWDAAELNPFVDGGACAIEERKEEVSAEYPSEGISSLPPHPDWEHAAHQSSKPFGIIEGTVTTSVGGMKLGEVVALTFDSFGNLIIFHRGSRIWDSSSFDMGNMLQDRRPITEDVILITYPNGFNKTLSLLYKYGSGKFYMPHGLTVDHQNDYYTTDVGSHQVIKWTLSKGTLAQVFALGEKFVPGDDQKHFCKPTSVAVTVDGDIFVADGYCNNRIMKFNRDGNFIAQWGQSSYSMMNMGSVPLGTFSLPHSVVTNDNSSLLYVADRENARIQIFRTSGQPVGQIVNPTHNKAFWNIYSAHYHNNAVYFIPGERQNGVPLRAFNAHAEAAQVQYSFEPTSYQFNRPHTIRVSPDGRYIYIGELGESGGRVLQFVIRRDSDEANNRDSLISLQSSLIPVRNPKFPISIILLVAIVAVPVLAFCLYRRKKQIRIGKQQSILDRAGFRPLRTDDPETSDDESEDDTILARQKGNHKF